MTSPGNGTKSKSNPTEKNRGKTIKAVLPIIAVFVAAIIAVIALSLSDSQKYFFNTVTTYNCNEKGEVASIMKYTYYDRFMFPLEASYTSEEYSYSMLFTLDDKDRITKVNADYADTDEDFLINISYSKKDGKETGTGSYKNAERETAIEIVYESKSNFTVTIKDDGELTSKIHCYISDDDYSVTETEFPTEKSIVFFDGINLIEQRNYERENADSEFKLIYRQANTYNKDGFLTESLIENGGEEITTAKTVYERNPDNIPTSIKWYENGEEINHTKIAEESDSKLVLKVLDNANETIGFYEYGFDGKKLLYEKTSDSKNVTDSRTTYNENGLTSQEIYHSEGKALQKTVYEYKKK